MQISRPDLSRVDPTVRSYIEALEQENERLRREAVLAAASRRSRVRASSSEEDEETGPVPEVFEPAEEPTTINVLTITASGHGKRTPRHYYRRQRRGGMGVFDLDAPDDETPAVLSLADAGQFVLALTNQARAFRIPVSGIPEEEVRARGDWVMGKLSLLEGERLVSILPDQAQGYVAMVSARGFVRLLRHHVFGEYMKPGMSLYDPRAFGPLASACWSQGDGDLFVATRQGKAIRFSEKEKPLPPLGGLGIRLTDGDEAVAITPVYEDSGVFLLAADGKGTIRLMEGFSANKAPGAGGKIAMNTDHLVFAATVSEDDDIFIVSRLSKIIRFSAAEVPEKDGVVQGVICMNLRADEVVAASIARLSQPLF